MVNGPIISLAFSKDNSHLITNLGPSISKFGHRSDVSDTKLLYTGISSYPGWSMDSSSRRTATSFGITDEIPGNQRPYAGSRTPSWADIFYLFRWKLGLTMVWLANGMNAEMDSDSLHYSMWAWQVHNMLHQVRDTQALRHMLYHIQALILLSCNITLSSNLVQNWSSLHKISLLHIHPTLSIIFKI